MNTIKFIFTVAILTTLIYACNQTSSGIDKIDDAIKTVTQEDSPTPHPELISKDTFDAWTTRWNNNFRAYMENDSLHYFNMPLVDLEDILAESPVDSARFYMGMDDKELPHLMLVGTNKGVPNFDVIADYTKVCPPLCDKN